MGPHDHAPASWLSTTMDWAVPRGPRRSSCRGPLLSSDWFLIQGCVFSNPSLSTTMDWAVIVGPLRVQFARFRCWSVIGSLQRLTTDVFGGSFIPDCSGASFLGLHGLCSALCRSLPITLLSQLCHIHRADPQQRSLPSVPSTRPPL